MINSDQTTLLWLISNRHTQKLTQFIFKTQILVWFCFLFAPTVSEGRFHKYVLEVQAIITFLTIQETNQVKSTKLSWPVSDQTKLIFIEAARGNALGYAVSTQVTRQLNTHRINKKPQC